MKKGDLSMNTIVGAAIAVLILVIVIIIVARQLGDKNMFIKDCQPNHGTCEASSDDCKTAGGIPGPFSCEKEYKGNKEAVCCTFPLGQEEDTQGGN